MTKVLLIALMFVCGIGFNLDDFTMEIEKRRNLVNEPIVTAAQMNMAKKAQTSFDQINKMLGAGNFIDTPALLDEFFRETKREYTLNKISRKQNNQVVYDYLGALLTYTTYYTELGDSSNAMKMAQTAWNIAKKLYSANLLTAKDKEETRAYLFAAPTIIRAMLNYDGFEKTAKDYALKAEEKCPELFKDDVFCGHISLLIATTQSSMQTSWSRTLNQVAEKWVTAMGDREYVLLSYTEAKMFYETNQYKQAEIAVQEALKRANTHATKVPNNVIMGDVYMLGGDIEVAGGHSERAANWYNKAIEHYAKNVGNKSPKSLEAKSKLASVYFYQQEAQKCIDVALEAMGWLEPNDVKNSDFATLASGAFVLLKDYSSALIYAEEAFRVYAEIYGEFSDTALRYKSNMDYIKEMIKGKE